MRDSLEAQRLASLLISCSVTVAEIVNDDMPFLVDSVTMEINRLGLATHLTVHPVMKTRRDAAGGLMEILPSDVSQSGPSESVMHVEVDRQTAPEKLAELEAGISRILGDVHRAVEDYPRMKEYMNRVVAEIRTPYPEGLEMARRQALHFFRLPRL